MSVKAECTWGEGPDVLVVLTGVHTAGAHLPAGHRHQGYYTLVRHPDGKWSFGMSIEETKTLVSELLIAVKQAEELDAAVSKPQKQRRITPEPNPPKCPCGWPIPTSLIPVPTELLKRGGVSRESILRGVSVVMHCPECCHPIDLMLDIHDSERDH
jgi:hypothetical protein